MTTQVPELPTPGEDHNWGEELNYFLVQLTARTLAVEARLPIPGPPGPRGLTGPIAQYVHTQTEAAASWTIVHNLGTVRAPSVVLDSAPTEIVYTSVEVIDLNTISLSFDIAVTGKAYL